MNCDKYQKLVPREKSQFIGLLLHAVQNDDEFFELGALIINKAENKGTFENVTILPAPIQEPPSENF